MDVWTIEEDEYDSFVVGVAPTVEAAAEWLRKRYGRPDTKVREPVRYDDSNWSVQVGRSTYNLEKFVLISASE